MPFPRKLLNEGEDIVLDLRPHWWALVKPALAVVVAAALVVLVANAVDHDLPTYAAVAVLMFTVVWMVARYLGWASTNFVVTTDRLIHRAGVLGKSGREIPLERVNDIAVSQTFLERLIGKGDLLIESGGERGQQHFTDVRRPFVVQNTIYREMERAGARDAERATGVRERSIPEQIEKLDELRQRGVVSQAEFEAKKAQLLERM
ncbi:MAG TPA: PH domain-containing protein [Acidimicrobiales bacterium]|nr:PH domain-containing protein [Acidimicrobiales bacterium]